MNRIKSIIQEEIEHIITEKKKGKGKKGQHKFVNHSDEDTHNKKLNSEDEKEIQNDLDTDIINIAALAKKVYPDHTDAGAQSQLRKHIKNIKNDSSGAIYHIRKKEAEKIRKELSKL